MLSHHGRPPETKPSSSTILKWSVHCRPGGALKPTQIRRESVTEPSTVTAATRELPEPLLWNAKQTCTALNIGERLLWVLTNRRAIPHVRIGKRVLYDPLDVRAWIDNQKVGVRR